MVAQTVTLDELQEKLTAHQLVRGQYTQAKKMQMFKLPLLSSGDFVLEQQQGLLWRQNKPFKISLTLSKYRLSQQFVDQPADIIQASDNPMVFYFSHLFLSLFKGDIEGLTEQFVIKLQSGEEQWSLFLTPKNAPLNNIFKQITISGSSYINQLLLTELNGDSSEILFFNQSNMPTRLSKGEQSAFQF